MDWVSVVLALGGSIITGIITLLGVYLTNRSNYKIYKNEAIERQKERNKQVILNRPEFEILDVKRKFNKTGYIPDNSFDIDCMVTIYGEKYSPDDFVNNLVCVEYTLKNITDSQVEHLDLCYYHKQFELLDMKSANIERFCDNPDGYPTSGFIRYAGRNIKHNQEIKIRIWYRSNQVAIRTFVSYVCFLGFMSFDCNYWIQSLDAPSENIEASELINAAKYYELIYRNNQ